MAINKEALDLIKRFEGFRSKAYLDPVNVLTIGYGHTNLSGYPPKITPSSTISEAEASKLLERVLEDVYEKAVDRNVKVPLNENQRGALVSFTYNLGEGNLKKSTLLKKLNAKDYAGAAAEFPKWNKAGGKVLKGLVRRREAEQKLFLKAAPLVGPATTKPTDGKDTPGLIWAILKWLFSK